MNGTIITTAHFAIDEAFNVDESAFPHSYWAATSCGVGGAIFSLFLLPVMEDFGIRYVFLTLIWTGFFPRFIFAMPEIRGSAILRARAQKLRKEGKKTYTQDELDTTPLFQVILKSVQRPLAQKPRGPWNRDPRSPSVSGTGWRFGRRDGEGMFVYAWTSYSFLPWIAPAIGLAMVGAGTTCVVVSIAYYLVDAYSKYAGSAVGAIGLGENIFIAFLPLAAQSMYTNLGFQWASSLLGFVSLVLAFAPVAVLIWGNETRARSPFMKEAAEDKRRDSIFSAPTAEV
ncbi:hypothetical protein BBP40_011036 [Aspergillus hancockii]|nr:hypothetical protein BBP40_011036 [Aspergillus hancockii]